MSDREIPIVLAITGTIGAGKTAVAKILASKGVPTVDADILAREVTSPGSSGLAAIAASFGNSYLKADGSLDRKKLAKLIFSDSNSKSALEAILHPQIRERWLSELRELKKSKDPRHELIAYIIPLYFETGAKYPEVNKVLVVTASEVNCVQRVKSRDGISEAEALRRIRAQLPSSEKERRADFVIRNDGSYEELETAVTSVVEDLLR